MTDGKSLLYGLREALNEDSTSSWLVARTSYDYLYQAAIEFVARTEAMRNEQSITTVADQSAYTLNANFLNLYLRNKDNEFYIKYNDGSANHFIKSKDYEDIIYEDNTSSVTIPDHFAIIDDSTIDTQVTGTCTTAGAASAGQATLTDSAADFSDVSAGDTIHNTTDESDGIVLSKTSSTVLVTALFDGTDNAWDSSDAYVIQPQTRLKLILTPPPSTSSHTITFYYIERPAPVYSDYGIYRIQSQYLNAIVSYAAWLYKYRDAAPVFGDRLFILFNREVKRAASIYKRSMKRNRWSVNFKKRN